MCVCVCVCVCVCACARCACVRACVRACDQSTLNLRKGKDFTNLAARLHSELPRNARSSPSLPSHHFSGERASDPARSTHQIKLQLTFGCIYRSTCPLYPWDADPLLVRPACTWLHSWGKAESTGSLHVPDNGTFLDSLCRWNLRLFCKTGLPKNTPLLWHLLNKPSRVNRSARR